MTNSQAAQVIEMIDLGKNFGHVHAVHDLSLRIPRGQIYGFLGPNGAGKTTTIRCIMDFIRPSHGEIKLFGQLVVDASPNIWNKVGYLSSDAAFYDSWTGAQHIDYLAKIRSTRGSAQRLAERLELDTHTKVRQLSTGNRQKLAIVMALMHNPQLLILDEPTRGLDPLLQREFYLILREIRNQGNTVFMSSHNLSEVEQICDEVGIIRSGELITSSSLSNLRKMQNHIITVHFGEDYDVNDFKLPNVEVTHQINHELIISVEGDFNELLRRLTKYKLRDVDISHASLEEIFMRYYK